MQLRAILLWLVLVLGGTRLEARSCLLAILEKFSTSATRSLELDNIHAEVEKLAQLYPRGSKGMETIHKRHRLFSKLLSDGHFKSVEELLAATHHFYGDHKFDLVGTAERLSDRIVLKENLTLEDFSPDKKGKILLSDAVPSTPEAYQQWLVQLSKSFHHADLHRIAKSVSTNPLASNGTWLHQYKARVESQVKEREDEYRAFLDRMSRVYPEFKDEFPTNADPVSVPRYLMRSAAYLGLSSHPWAELNRRPLTQTSAPVRTNHQLYWPRWLLANQARLAGIATVSGGVLLAGYYFSLDDDELEELKEEAFLEVGELLKKSGLLESMKDFRQASQNNLEKRISEINAELENTNREISRGDPSSETLKRKEALEFELKELTE